MIRRCDKIPEPVIAGSHRSQSWSKGVVARAIGRGELPPASACSKCGTGGVVFINGASSVQYHHWSYLPEHALDVMPLCIACHRKVHRGLAPDPTTGVRFQHQRVMIQLPPTWTPETRAIHAAKIRAGWQRRKAAIAARATS